MDDRTAYYAPPIHHPYYQPAPPPPPPGTVYHPPPSIAQPIHVDPQYITYAPPVYPQSTVDQLRTLFVAGLPEDVKSREIYNLFREFPGYQSYHFRPTNTKPFAFATFVDQQSAIMALHALNGMVFDLEKGSPLHIDLAKSNPRPKRPRGDYEGQDSEKRQKGSVFSRSYDSGVGSIHVPGLGNSAHNTIGYPSTQSSGDGDHGTKNYPCPTLFVASLSQAVTEKELMEVFSRCRGFIKLKIQRNSGRPIAFVDFQDTSCSTEALSYLQDYRLRSSGSDEGMRLEFAKSRMGKPSKKTGDT